MVPQDLPQPPGFWSCPRLSASCLLELRLWQDQGLAVVSPLRVDPRGPLVTLEVGSHCGPAVQAEPGQGQPGWPHSPHVSILDGPVVGGPSMSVVQYSRVLTTAECEGRSAAHPHPPASEAGVLTPCPMGGTPHSDAEAQGWLDQAHSLRWGHGAWGPHHP